MTVELLEKKSYASRRAPLIEKSRKKKRIITFPLIPDQFIYLLTSTSVISVILSGHTNRKKKLLLQFEHSSLHQFEPAHISPRK